MNDKCLVLVVTGVNGVRTPHDGRYVMAWTPHVAFGTVAVNSTKFPRRARQFDGIAQVLAERNTVSIVQPRRPNDGQPNRPLSALHIQIVPVRDVIPELPE